MKIYVDAGHGGSDPGAVAAGIREADLVLPYAYALQVALEDRGHTVHMSRTADTFPSLRARTDEANALDVDCFVSLHANASFNPEANGFQVFHAAGSERGEALAGEILEAARAVTGTTRWTGAFPDGSAQVGHRTLHVLRATRMPAVLVELGFMTHAEERETLIDSAYRGLLCLAIADAIEGWADVERPDLPEPDVDVRHPPGSLETPDLTAVETWLVSPDEVAKPGEATGDMFRRVLPWLASELLEPAARIAVDRILEKIEDAVGKA